uniref:ORF109 n=1 Tax=Cydia pomonella granulosis virus TaxID=28289 RepID=A0A6B9I906_GVCP|nr:ORF109 [Cydia pomonella granulovirus]QGZ00045.1 ORF109 [Cydia pomonella granulovirus]
MSVLVKNPVKNPSSLYLIAIIEIRKHFFNDDKGSIKKLPIPKTVSFDLETLYAELPPGWYYCPDIHQCVIDETLFDPNIHRELCSHWKKENINNYYRAVNTFVFWEPFSQDPVDDIECIYMTPTLIQERLLTLFALGAGNFLKPWMGGVTVISELAENYKLVKYIKLKVDYVPPSWLKVVKHDDVDDIMLL